jgi:RNA recognition motif-containing protein
MPSKLYVGNLAYDVTQEDLSEFFSQVGAVQSAAVISDKFSGQSRGFGFVEMSDSQEADRAIETLNDTELKGRRVKIDRARETAPRSGGSGDRRRGGGGGGGGRGGRGPRW